MTQSEFLEHMEYILQLEPKTLNASDELESLKAWDSLAIISFMALGDEQFQARVNAKQIGACITISDLMRLFGSRIVPDADYASRT